MLLPAAEAQGGAEPKPTTATRRSFAGRQTGRGAGCPQERRWVQAVTLHTVPPPPPAPRPAWPQPRQGRRQPPGRSGADSCPCGQELGDGAGTLCPSASPLRLPDPGLGACGAQGGSPSFGSRGHRRAVRWPRPGVARPAGLQQPRESASSAAAGGASASRVRLARGAGGCRRARRVRGDLPPLPWRLGEGPAAWLAAERDRENPERPEAGRRPDRWPFRASHRLVSAPGRCASLRPAARSDARFLSAAAARARMFLGLRMVLFVPLRIACSPGCLAHRREWGPYWSRVATPRPGSDPPSCPRAAGPSLAPGAAVVANVLCRECPPRVTRLPGCPLVTGITAFMGSRGAGACLIGSRVCPGECDSLARGGFPTRPSRPDWHRAEPRAPLEGAPSSRRLSRRPASPRRAPCRLQSEAEALF